MIYILGWFYCNCILHHIHILPFKISYVKPIFYLLGKLRRH